MLSNFFMYNINPLVLHQGQSDVSQQVVMNNKLNNCYLDGITLTTQLLTEYAPQISVTGKNQAYPKRL